MKTRGKALSVRDGKSSSMYARAKVGTELRGRKRLRIEDVVEEEVEKETSIQEVDSFDKNERDEKESEDLDIECGNPDDNAIVIEEGPDLPVNNSNNNIGSVVFCQQSIDCTNAKTAYEKIMHPANRPPLPTLARARKVCPPKLGKTRKSAHAKHDLDTSYSHRRCDEFKDECLIVEANSLYCNACCETLSNKKQCTVQHIRSNKHLMRKEEYLRKGSKSQTVCAMFQKKILASGDEAFSGQTLSADNLTQRFLVTEVFLKAAIPLNTLDDPVSGLRELVERATGPLSVRHMRDLIPDVRNMEYEILKSELKNAGFISVIFDGTTDVCEVVAVIFRWVDMKMRIHQRLVKAKFCKKALNADQVANVILTTLFAYQVLPNGVLAFVRDGASVNTSAVRSLNNVCLSSKLIFNYKTRTDKLI